MKISDVVYTTMGELDAMPRFDLMDPVRKPKWYLQIVAWLLSFPETFITHATIKKHNVNGLKGPYIMLCNHNSFLDFKVATRAVFPQRSNYIVAIDGFINRESLLRNVGGFCKRKFVSDSTLVRQVKHSLTVNKVICQIYPEARYSLMGTTSPLPDSLGKLVKRMKHPVVTLVSHGHHLRQPFWNLHKRKVKTMTDMTQIITQEEVNTLSVEEINQRIREAFVYDDYQYQFENKIAITYKDRAKNIHKVLYQCPNCLTEFTMKSEGNKIWCETCGEVHEMDEYGRLHNTKQETRFEHIPDWYNWIRSQVRDQILQGTYDITMDVMVESLPNSTGFYRLGVASLTHNQDGFHLTGVWDHGTLDVQKPVLANFGVHVEFDYFGKGDCVSFSTSNDTYYLYPVDQSYSVTKFHFATEELYDIQSQK